MKEQFSTISAGLLAHFGPSVYFIFMIWWFNSNDSVSVIDITNLFLLSAMPVALVVLYLERKFPIVYLDPVTTDQLFQSMIDTFVDGLLIGPGVIFAIRWVFASASTNDSIWKSVLYFVLIDLSYYVIHRFFYHNHYYKTFYTIHLPHHRIKYLDFLRGSHSSILDNGVVGYQLSCAVWSCILSVSINQTLIVYYLILLLQVTHHANFTFNIDWLRYIFIDSHCHKLHHCVGGGYSNLGGILSIWDLLFGTFYENHELCANELHADKICITNS